ncbi:hypothetical protein Ancab_022873 [Ancistrocladus abbreviatus]
MDSKLAIMFRLSIMFLFKKLARAYLVEAKWICDGYVPTVEYVDVAITTASSSFIPAVLFAGMEDATEDAYHWACSVPKIGEASAIVTRLFNDSICEKEPLQLLIVIFTIIAIFFV